MMIDRRLGAFALIALALAGCASSEVPEATSRPPAAAPHAGRGPAPADEAATYRETTQPEISGRWVGIADIFARDLPDRAGVVAPRVSARLAIRDPASEATRQEIVFAGSVLALGADRYEVVDVRVAASSPGTITLRKLR